jgi:DNA-binding response OmpR family regulator
VNQVIHDRERKFSISPKFGIIFTTRIFKTKRPKMKVLIVEDEKALSDSISTYLNSEQYVCEIAENFSAAIRKIMHYDYACIILDINLPDGSGLQILKELKASKKTEGILIISARNSLSDKLTGLNSGADDYLIKPFHLSELAARVSAIIRRKSFNGNNVLKFEELELDVLFKTVYVNGGIIDLTRKEYDLLLYFITNKNKVISKGAIAEHLWGDNMDLADSYDFIYTHIKNLRKKLLNSGAGDYLKSVYGMGYKFSAR